MNKLNIGLIGYGTVGSGVVKFLQNRKKFIKKKFNTEFAIKSICDIRFRREKGKKIGKALITSDYRKIINDKDIDIVIELVGGMHPALEIALSALKNGKHVITANKELISREGKTLFKAAKKYKKEIYFESTVGAGIPIIQSIIGGLAGNTFKGLYGIINGTCNFILSEMTKSGCTFTEALREAQKKGYAEKNPTLDINGMDTAHKLEILVFLALGKFIKLKDIYVEGITHISHIDIDYAKKLDLTIKLLAIAKRKNKNLEVHVHPTLLSDDHPLASVNGVYNAVFLEADPMGDVLLYGQGAGQMTAASGIISDLINLARYHDNKSTARTEMLSSEASGTKIRKIDQIETKFYIRFHAIDRPGVLSKISGILGKYGISIASVSQQVRKKASAVPVIIVTHHAKEIMVRKALEKIYKLSIIKGKPVAIRMENL